MGSSDCELFRREAEDIRSTRAGPVHEGLPPLKNVNEGVASGPGGSLEVDGKTKPDSDNLHFQSKCQTILDGIFKMPIITMQIKGWDFLPEGSLTLYFLLYLHFPGTFDLKVRCSASLPWLEQYTQVVTQAQHSGQKSAGSTSTTTNSKTNSTIESTTA
ncbi:hypothetical protein RUM43_005576 [Polyplax serrata]|uniref:Uncharacterized protein n=1 Tax=Polyplax serrata TaxID=468196 RepID=A0AAN8NWA1_POLSC